MHNALAGPFREHSLCPRDPSSAREVALVQQSKRKPECASRGALPVAAAEERVVRASQDIFALRDFPNEVGGIRKPFEIVAFQRRFTIGRCKTGKRITPCATRKRLASSVRHSLAERR